MKFHYLHNWVDSRGTICGPIFRIYLFHLFWTAMAEHVCKKKASESVNRLKWQQLEASCRCCWNVTGCVPPPRCELPCFGCGFTPLLPKKVRRKSIFSFEERVDANLSLLKEKLYRKHPVKYFLLCFSIRHHLTPVVNLQRKN